MGMRLGIDLVDVADVSAAIEEHGDRYLRRVYTQQELADSSRADGSMDHERLAARFAAKEAARKVIGCTGGVPFTEIETVRETGGAPAINLYGDTLARAQAAGLSEISVSLTHDAGLAAAVVAGEATR